MTIFRCTAENILIDCFSGHRQVALAGLGNVLKIPQYFSAGAKLSDIRKMTSTLLQALKSFDHLEEMKKQEKWSAYANHNFFHTTQKNTPESLLIESIISREKICTWTYNVIDHFQLSRSTVALSMNLYDRYLATCGNNCEGNFLLLCSLSTLFIAIKLREPRKRLDQCNISRLSKLSRGNFRERDIEEMELKILHSLSWLVNPPLASEFIPIVLNLPSLSLHSFVRQQIFESSQYMVELTVCDPFFIESTPSVIAFAAILNALEEDIDSLSFSSANRSKFLQEMFISLSLKESDHEVCMHRERMQKILSIQKENDTIDVKKGAESPSSVCDLDYENDCEINSHDENHPTTQEHRSFRGHRRYSSADSVDFSTLGDSKRRHRRISSADSLDVLRRIQLV